MKRIILSAALAGVISSPAWAQKLETEKMEMEDAFQKADIITDSQIDPGEFDIYNLGIFDALDEDGDRALIQEECYSGCFPTGVENAETVKHYQFEGLDANRNGQVAQAEYISYARKQFTDYDRNEDKSLNKEEFFAFYQGMDERTFMVKSEPTK